MAAITEGEGKDLISPKQMRRIDTRDYLAAHLLGVISREQRLDMYSQMLCHGIYYQNDDITLSGLQGTVSHILNRKEVSADIGEEFFDSPPDEERENDFVKGCEKVVALIEEIVTNYSFYQHNRKFNPRYNPGRFEVALPKTWAFVLSYTSLFFRRQKIFGKDKNQISPLNTKAFDLYCRLGTTELLRTAAKNTKIETSISWVYMELDYASLDEVTNRFKVDANEMILESVIFFLKYNGGELPPHILKILRIEYARKGGIFKLD